MALARTIKKVKNAFTWLLVPHFFFIFEVVQNKNIFYSKQHHSEIPGIPFLFDDVWLFTGCADIFCICYWTHDYFQQVLKRDQNKRTILTGLLITCIEMNKNTFLIITVSAGKQTNTHLTEKKTRAPHPDINGLRACVGGRSFRSGRVGIGGGVCLFLTSSQYQRICKQTIWAARL